MGWEEIVAEAATVDGVASLDEATLRALRHHPGGVRWWEEPEGFAAYVDGGLSLVVRPSARGRGVGRGLLERAVGRVVGVSTSSTSGAAGAEAAASGAAGSGAAGSEAPVGSTISAWSHADHPGAAALAAEFGFARVRELWLMVRPGDLPLPPLVTPDGLVLRPYAEADAEALIRVNAAAFASHPEQGAMDAAGLAERMAEGWFDPAGLLLTTDATTGRLLGFHWTKRVSPTLGEVYVVGVDPSAQGRGVGKFVTLAGLHHLTDRGAESIELYVESDNAVARATYESLGFGHVRTHVMYRR